MQNGLTGTIPRSLIQLSKLSLLCLATNQNSEHTTGISGTIPSGISAVTSLQEIFLYNNDLTGTIRSCASSVQCL